MSHPLQPRVVRAAKRAPEFARLLDAMLQHPDDSLHLLAVEQRRRRTRPA